MIQLQAFQRVGRRSVRRPATIGMALLCLLTLAFTAPAAVTAAAAQSAVSPVRASDIQRLQNRLADLRASIVALRARNATRADRLMATFDDLQDEVTYLKVKLRKEGSVTHQEYGDLSGRIADLETQVSSTDAAAAGVPREAPAPPPMPAPPAMAPADQQEQTPLADVPVGTELDARLQSTLSSATALVEDKVKATTAADLVEDGQVLIPAGSVLRGIVSSVTKATRTDRKGQLTLSFNRITVNGTTYQMTGTVTQASAGIKGEAGKIGTGAGVGAIIGGLLGGFKGALAGILIGGGGMVAATPGKDVELPAGTILRVRIDSPLTVAAGDGGN